jgi:hypothetical protein
MYFENITHLTSFKGGSYSETTLPLRGSKRGDFNISFVELRF